MKKKQKETESKTEKKLFTKGGKPGPGRGHRKPVKPLDSDEFEAVIAEGLRSKDGKERAVWARVRLAYEKQIDKSKGVGSEMEPFVGDITDLLSTVAYGYLATCGIPITSIDAIEVIRNHMTSCPTSPASNKGFIEFYNDEIDDDL